MKKIGQFDFGTRSVNLFWKEGTGGAFYMNHESDGQARIVLGVNERSWGAQVAVLLHEALELAMADHACRFNPAPDYSWDSANYLFVMNHPQFSEIVARVGLYVSNCLPALSQVYKAQNKRKK